ncbi:MAG: YwqG family protein [Chloroflexota bacterium]
MKELIQKYQLTQYEAFIRKYTLPAIGFEFTSDKVGNSKMGGYPLLPPNFEFPRNKGRNLDFLLQIDFAELQQFSPAQRLPSDGFLTFFYDLIEESWGYDPDDLDGFSVIYFSASANLTPYPLPMQPEFPITEYFMDFFLCQTVPHFGSRMAEQLKQEAAINDVFDEYWDFLEEFEYSFRSSEKSGNHHLFGHSANVQGDMQLEAQLVTNGLYCGDSSGYKDPRAKQLESGCEDWILLLQLDTDDNTDVMWGDAGMLYYWIRQQDLQARRFDRVWMTMQCY